MTLKGDHAVVCGAGMAGLFTARVLSDHYRTVTIIERDQLGHGIAPRRGVPQGRHVHGLTPHAYLLLENAFPGFNDEIMAHGATRVRFPEDVLFEYLGQQLCSPPSEHYVVPGTRPFLEAHLRRRVLAAPGVVLRDGWEVAGVLASPEGDRVTGVRINRPGDRDGVELEADLVVDALGRAGRGRTWLDALNYPRPPEQRLHAGVRYASRHYRLQPGAPSPAIYITPHPARRRGMVLFTQEGQTIVASLTGYGEWVPPASADDFLACVRDLVQDDVYALVRDAEPIDDIATYRFPAGHRRRYERLRRHPPGLISTGDSICCLNPVYGAGVTIAAELAVLLGDCLRRTDDQAGLPRRFYAGADRITRAPWLMSTLSDRVINPPSRPSPATALTAFYMRRVAATAARDPEVATALFESVGMIASPLTLARPRFLARVLLPTRRSPAARPPGLRQAINPAQENRRAPA